VLNEEPHDAYHFQARSHRVNLKSLTGALVAVALSAPLAQASGFVYVGSGLGTECSQFQNFQQCEYDGSPTIIKFDAGLGVDEINSAFASITGEEWAFTNITTNSDGEILSLTWTYTPNDAADPFITAFAPKYGRGFDMYAGSGYTGSFEVGQGLSHLTFFDTGIPPCTNGDCPPDVPEPTSLILMGLGLFGAATAARRRR